MLIVSGPIKMPTGPKRAIPPKTEKRIENGGIFTLCPTMYGFKQLSHVPTISVAQIKRPIDEPVCPVAKRKITAGTDTIAVPKGGMIEAIPAKTAQIAGFGT